MSGLLDAIVDPNRSPDFYIRCTIDISNAKPFKP